MNVDKPFVFDTVQVHQYPHFFLCHLTRHQHQFFFRFGRVDAEASQSIEIRFYGVAKGRARRGKGMRETGFPQVGIAPLVDALRTLRD